MAKFCKYYDETIKDLKEGFWGYQYSIEYWSQDQNQRKICTGVVLSVSIEAAFEQVRDYYIDEEDEIIEIRIKEMSQGELGSNLVLEITDAVA